MTRSVRAETNLVRLPGVWETNGAVSDEQLRLPVEAPGIGVVLAAATGRLRLSPDFDIVVWLGERWLEQGLDPDGWVGFTYSQLVRALYNDASDGGGGRRAIRASLLRLMSTLFTIDGIDTTVTPARTNARIATTSAVITELAESKQLIRTEDIIRLEGGRARLTSDAARRFGGLRGSTVKVRLAGWMCAQLAAKGWTYLDFATLRKLDGAAKRTWVYLQAESGHPLDEHRRLVVIGLGRPALNCLGVGNYREHRQARAALKRAGKAICAVDHRYESVEVHRRARNSHQLRAVMLTPAGARERARRLRSQEAERVQAELDAREQAQQRAQEAIARSSFAALANGPVMLRAWPADERHPDDQAADELIATPSERERMLVQLVGENGPMAASARRRLAELYASHPELLAGQTDDG